VVTTDDEAAVLAAARRRAAALAAGDPDVLVSLLHESFVWTSHRGERFDRAAYLAANAGTGLRWLRQELFDERISVVDDVAVLVAVVRDTVDAGGGPEVFTMPLTQVWVRVPDGWRCLAGHAGPRLG